jgi:hypothetical protein
VRCSAGTSGSGGAIIVADAAVVLRNDTFAGCAAGDSGGAVSIMGFSRVDMGRSRFESNTASLSGGAVAVVSATSAVLTASTFSYDIAGFRGGALMFDRVSRLAATALTVRGASSGVGGGGGIAVVSVGGASSPSASISGSVLSQCTTLGNGGAVLWLSSKSSSLGIVAANKSVDGMAIIGGGGAVFVDAAPSDTGVMTVNGDPVPLSATAPPAAGVFSLPWTRPFVYSTASFGSVMATSPRQIRLRCRPSSGSTSPSALATCPPNVTLSQFQRNVIVQVVDVFGQHVTSQSSGSCVVAASVDVTGAIGAVRRGSSDFPSLSVIGRRGDFYNVSVACTFGTFVLDLPASEQLRVQVPLCAAGEEVTEDRLLCRSCGVGTFSVDGSSCISPDAGHFSKDPRFQGARPCLLRLDVLWSRGVVCGCAEHCCAQWTCGGAVVWQSRARRTPSTTAATVPCRCQSATRATTTWCPLLAALRACATATST